MKKNVYLCKLLLYTTVSNPVSHLPLAGNKKDPSDYR